MSGFVVLGTDTDAGKTAFSLLILAALPDEFAYWKPVETGEFDTAKVRSLVADTQVFDPVARFIEPVAPLLAARREGRVMPSVAEVLAARPTSTRPLLVETFGGPFSPFDEQFLQIELIRGLGLPCVLVGSTAVGAIGRMLGMIAALEAEGLRPGAIVLLGERDSFAEEQLQRRLADLPVISLTLPAGAWSPGSLREAAAMQMAALHRLRDSLAMRMERFSAKPQAAGNTVWHPYTPLRGEDAPLAVVAAVDEFLRLADGRRVIDGISSWWTILHGHRHPRIMKAIREATRSIDHVAFAGVTHPHAVEVAESLLAFMPWSEGGRVFFSDNGSTAVEVALKMAYQFWRHQGEANRTLFVGFEDCYHGDTFGAMAVSRDPLFFGQFEPLLFETLRVPVNPASLDEALSRNAGRVAGVILEPLVQGAGGMRMHSSETLRAIFDVAQRHGVLFIADEVMTGFGRTGSLFAFEPAGIAPDLVCTAKALTGGVLPLAATLASPRIVAAFDSPDRARTFFHGHSFTANPLACAAAAANLQLLRSSEWKGQVERIRRHFTTHLQPLASRLGVKDVRTCGLIAAIELDVPGGYLADCAAILRRTSLEHGVMLRPLGNVLYAMPPLCTSDESLKRITDAMIAAVERAASS